MEFTKAVEELKNIHNNDSICFATDVSNLNHFAIRAILKELNLDISVDFKEEPSIIKLIRKEKEEEIVKKDAVEEEKKTEFFGPDHWDCDGINHDAGLKDMGDGTYACIRPEKDER